MINFKSNVLFVLMSFFFLHSAYAIETLSKPIEKIQINAVQEDGKVYYFFYNSSGWGACHQTQGVYVRVEEGTPGAQAIFSASLAAKASGATVKYAGQCFNDSTFDANYMYLE